MYTTFAKLGDRLEDAHRAVGYDETAFAALSHAFVSRHRLDRRFDLETLAGEVLLHPTTLAAWNDGAGQPAVTVYRGRRFVIELVLALDPSTAVKQQAVTGTLQVIAGASLYTTYAWTTTRFVDSRFEIGRAAWQATERLGPGDIRPILPGERAHRLYHLEKASITMVVRTTDDDRARPQYGYHLPWFRSDVRHVDHGTRMKQRLLLMLRAIKSPELPRALRGFARRASFPDLYALMAQLEPGSPEGAILAEGAGRRFPDLAELSAETLATSHRSALLTRCRAAATEPRQRFLLALLANLDSEEAVLAQLRAAYPRRDPSELVVELVGGLSTDQGLAMNEETLGVFRSMPLFGRLFPEARRTSS